MTEISRPSMNPAVSPRFYELDATKFEKMCRDLLAQEPSVGPCYLHGQMGEGDKGVDLKVLCRDGDGVEVGQCKCYRMLGPADIRKIAADFFKHKDHWQSQKVRRFVLFTACDLEKVNQHTAIAEVRARFIAEGIVFEAWDARILRDKLAPHGEIVYRYTRSPEWVAEICGPDKVAAAIAAQAPLLRSVSQPLSSVQVAEMFRKQGFYHPADYSSEGLCGTIPGSFRHDYQQRRIGGETLIL